MQFVELELPGAFLIEPDRRRDVRGYFARTWCAREFAAHGMERPMVQASTSFNKHQGTLRGLHYQAPPSQEEKLVRCSAGAIFDVIVDLRPTSPAFLKHVHFELSADNGRALFIPSGCAHGFQTLAPLSEVFYMMTDFFEPALSRGLRWNDPILDIQWPEDDRVIVERDAAYPDYGPAVLGELQRFPTPQKKNAD